MGTPGSLAVDRKSLVLFFSLTTVLCTVAYVPMLSGGGFEALGGYALPLLMWSPGIAGIVAAVVFHRSASPLGLLGNRCAPWWMIALLALPVMYALAIKCGLAAVGMVELADNTLARTLLLWGLYYSLRTALGEELGWRGFAAPVMARVFGFWRGQTLLGIFWFLFHVPALLGTEYGSSPHPWLGNLMFLLSCMALTYFLGWARLRSNSVWPSALFHTSHNLYFLHLFEPLTLKHASASYLVGEQGLLCAIVQASLAGLTLWTWQRKNRRSGCAGRNAC